MEFPSLIPSRRSFAPSEFNVKPHKLMSGGLQRMLYATSAYRAKLRLIYAHITPAQTALFLSHYDQMGGTHDSFKLPSAWAQQVWGGWNNKASDQETLAIKGRWRYAAPPRFQQPKIGVSSIEVTLLQVPGGEEPAQATVAYDVNNPPAWCEAAPNPTDDGTGPGPGPGGNQGGNGSDDDDPEPTPNPGPIGPIGPTPTPIPGPGPGDGGGEGPTPSPRPDWLDPDDHTPPDEDVIWLPPEFDESGRAALYQYTVIVSATQTNSGNKRCFDDSVSNEGGVIPGGGNPDKIFISRSFQGYALQIFLGVGNEIWQCEPPGNSLTACWVKFNRVIRNPNNDLAWTYYTQGDSWYNSKGTFDPSYELTRKWSTGCPDGGIRVTNSYSSPEYGSRLGINYWAEKPILVEKEFVKWNIVNDPTIPEEPDGPLLGPFNGPGPETGTAQSRTASSRSLSTSAQVATFPEYNPSRRQLKYGEWNTKEFAGEPNRQAVTLPLPSTAEKRDIMLQLVYANRADQVGRDFMNHYLQAYGSWQDFPLPAERTHRGPFAGWKVPDGWRYLSEGKWFYAGPPSVQSVHPGTSTTTLTLVCTDPNVIGASEIIPPQLPEECPCPPEPLPPVISPTPPSGGGNSGGGNSGGGGTDGGGDGGGDSSPTPNPEPTGPIGPEPTPIPGPGGGGGGTDDGGGSDFGDPAGSEELISGQGIYTLNYTKVFYYQQTYFCRNDAPTFPILEEESYENPNDSSTSYVAYGMRFSYYGDCKIIDVCDPPNTLVTGIIQFKAEKLEADGSWTMVTSSSASAGNFHVPGDTRYLKDPSRGRGIYFKNISLDFAP